MVFLKITGKHTYRVDQFLFDGEVAAAWVAGLALACCIYAAVAVSDIILPP
jgi:hypothetical protein